jgi:deazaflavin-dependent oxidoreductase (nitroreductase family)
VEAIGPSLVVRIALRPMTKILNPLVATLAGRRHFRMAAELRHVGRNSGKPYVTSAGARLSGNTIIIPLTFGNQSDWSRNVRAAGGCSIRVDGHDYQATRPELVDRRQTAPLARSAFSPLERASFRMLGIRQFMRLEITPNKTLWAG